MEKLRRMMCVIYIIAYFLVIEQLTKTSTSVSGVIHISDAICELDDKTGEVSKFKYPEYYGDVELPNPQKFVCCPGYTEVNSNATRHVLYMEMKCGPLCAGCDHGHCVDKQRCQCNLGYVKDATGSCVPKCESRCPGGVCIQPDRCRPVTRFADNLCNNPECINGCLHEDKCLCIGGYRKLNKTFCEPVCDKPCAKGHCVAPNWCTCDPGYGFNVTSETCEPVCSKACIFGKCIQPDVCGCSRKQVLHRFSSADICYTKNCEPCPRASCTEENYCPCGEGYEFNGPVCEPICANVTCGQNSFCSAPNKCSCLKNYRPLSNQTDACEPACHIGCMEHGTCADNDTCICDSGYKLDDGSNCVPICDPQCRLNEECVAPNECRCKVGYMLVDGVQCYPYCPDGCDNGYCSLPDRCACYSSFSNVENKCAPASIIDDESAEYSDTVYPFSAQEIAVWCMLSMDKIIADDLLDFSLLFDPDESLQRIFHCASIEACELNCTEDSFDALNSTSGGFVRCKVTLGAGTGALHCYTQWLPGVDIVDRCKPTVYSESGNTKSFLMSSSFSYRLVEKSEATSEDCWLRPCPFTTTEVSVSGRNIKAKVCPSQDNSTSSSHLGQYFGYVILLLLLALALAAVYFCRKRVTYYFPKLDNVRDVDKTFNNLSDIRKISGQLVTDD